MVNSPQPKVKRSEANAETLRTHRSAETKTLRAAEGEQRYLRRNAEAHRCTDRAKSAIDIEHRERRLGMAGSGRLVARQTVCLPDRPIIYPSDGNRPVASPGQLTSRKACPAQAVIEDFDLDLPA